MVAVPAAIPVIVPSVPAVATDVLLLLHAPPPVTSVYKVGDPIHNVDGPEIGAVAVFTETTVVALHPAAVV